VRPSENRQSENPESGNPEAKFLLEVGAWIKDTLPQVAEIARELAKANKTTRTCEPWSCRELHCQRRVVRYGPRDSHLQLTFWRRSSREWDGLRQADADDNLFETKRRWGRLPQHTKIVTLTCHRPVTLPAEVKVRIRARGEDPEAFLAMYLDAERQRDRARLSSSQSGRRSKPRYGHRVVDVPPQASAEECALAIGLPLVQEGVMDDMAVMYLLVTAMNIPEDLAKDVWKRLIDHFSNSQYPLSLRAYLTRVVKDLRPPQQNGGFRDESGTEYWSVKRAAQELGKDEATLYRWIRKRHLSQTKDGVPNAEIDRVKATFKFDQGVITLLCKAHKIKPTSAERAYRRLCARLNIETRAPIKSDGDQEAIRRVLHADLKVVRWRDQRRPPVKPRNDQEESEEA
jgi:hypothetical protein